MRLILLCTEILCICFCKFLNLCFQKKKSVPMDELDNLKNENEHALKSRDASPRSSVPQSPYPTPASSPLLNSLLKNSPSSSTTFQLPTAKEVSFF